MRSLFENLAFMFRLGRPSLRALGVLPFVSFIAGFLDGFGVALIIPLLAVIANEQGAVAAAPIFAWVEKVFLEIGLPYTPLGLIFAIFVLVLAKQGFYFLMRWYGLRVVYDTIYHLRLNLMKAILRAPLSFHDRKDASYMASLLERECLYSGSVLYSGLELLRVVTLVVFYLVTLALISWKMTLFSILLLLIMNLTARSQIRKSSEFSRSLVFLSGRFLGDAQDFLSGIQTIKSFNKESYISDRFAGIAKEIADTTFRQKMSAALVRIAVDPVMMASLLATIYVGAVVLALPFTMFVGFVAVLARLSLVAMEGNQNWIDITTNTESVKAIKSVYDDAIVGAEQDRGLGALDLEFAKQIELRNLSFEYVEGTPTLSDVNLSINKGATLGLAGRSGAGKTTLIQLISSQRLPTSGSILLDGREISAKEAKSFRHLFSFISQDVFLFRGTVFENIALGASDPRAADRGAVEQAARMAHAAEFIEALPGGYNFVLTERGGNLSGGQRQRLAIARALLSNTPVLIFDEGTSALDPISEQHIIAAIRELSGHRTILVIAHKLAMIEQCERVILLDNGRIVETGEPSTLLSGTSHLAKLFERPPANGVSSYAT